MGCEYGIMQRFRGSLKARKDVAHLLELRVYLPRLQDFLFCSRDRHDGQVGYLRIGGYWKVCLMMNLRGDHRLLCVVSGMSLKGQSDRMEDEILRIRTRGR